MAPNRNPYANLAARAMRSVGGVTASLPPRPAETLWKDRAYCSSITDARKYAQQLMPGVFLDYIPRKDRDTRNWIDDREYLDPQRGSLTWCHSGPPKTRNAIMRTKMYVIGNQVGATVDAVVKATKRNNQVRPGWKPGEDTR